MNWSNWLYLGVGLGLGVVSSWLFGRTKKKPSHSSLEASAIQQKDSGQNHLVQLAANSSFEETTTVLQNGSSDHSQLPSILPLEVPAPTSLESNASVVESVAGLQTKTLEPAKFSSPQPILRETSASKQICLDEPTSWRLAYQMAEEMSQFKTGFLARTTHVLRSPLNGLIGMHQLILADLCENPEEEREFIAQAHERALELLNLMDEILNVARTEHGTNKLDIQPLQLIQVLQQVHDLTYMLAENRNFRFRLLPPDPEIYVLADPRWLRQVLINLVDTAITNMEEGSICISAQASTTSNSVQIWLDFPTHAFAASESIDLIKSEDDENSTLLSGMKLLLNQTLLQVMGGNLEIVARVTEAGESSPESGQSAPNQLISSVSSHPDEHVSRLQLSIPLVIAEAELQH